MLLPSNIHPSWNDFLTDDIKKQLEEIEEKIGNDFNPSPDKVLRFLTIDLNEVKVIIQGMDPYPSKDRSVATGRSFEVGTLTSWNSKFRQTSLKNIVRLIYKNYNNIESHVGLKRYLEIKEEIIQNSFKILPPNEIFDSWEKQGVLCINRYLTCKIGVAESHKKIWNDFSIELIKYISTKNKSIKWFLWGAKSIDSKNYIQYGTIYEAKHPRVNGFLESDCFKDTMDEINWLG